MSMTAGGFRRIYDSVIDEYITTGMSTDMNNWKRFRRSPIRVSECFKNRWFIIGTCNITCGSSIIGIIDDQEGVFISFTSNVECLTVMKKMYGLSDDVSYEAYGYSKCDSFVLL